MHCSLQYDLGEQGYQFWWVLILGGVLAAVGVFIFYIGRETAKDRLLRFLFLRVGGLAFALAWGGFAIFVTVSSYSSYRHLLASYRDRRTQSVAGVVVNFSPYDPQRGKTVESFEVGGKEFSYSPNGFDAGYHQTEAQGSPLKEGVYARVAYADSQIVRLEICTGNGS